jgi:hypothetical protein
VVEFLSITCAIVLKQINYQNMRRDMLGAELEPAAVMRK